MYHQYYQFQISFSISLKNLEVILKFIHKMHDASFALISKWCKTKPAPWERISLQIHYATVVLVRKFKGLLKIKTVFKFGGCTFLQLANTISYSLNLLLTW